MRTEDLIGKKFGKLTIIAPAETRIKCGRYIKYCLCSCECGNKKEIRQDTILRGDTKSCGCLLKAIAEQNRNKTYIKSKWDKSILLQIAEIKSVSRKEVAKALGLKDSEIKYILRHFKTTLKDLQNK